MKSSTSKLITGIVVLIVIIIVASVLLNSKNKPNNLRIGDIATLTGNAAYYGQSTMKGAEVGRLQALKEHPGLSIELFNEDSLFTPNGGINAYTKLKAVNNINAAITMTSPVSMAVEPLAIKDGLILGAASTLAQKYSTPDDATFRLTSMASFEIVPLLEYLKTSKLTKLAILYMNNDTGVGLRDALVNVTPSYGIDIVSNEGYAGDTVDFRSILLKTKQSGAQVIYVASLANQTAKILVQAHELGINSKFVSYRGTEDPLLIKGANDLANGIIYTSGYDIASNSNQNKQFIDLYHSKYGEDPNEYSAEAYETVRVISDIYANCNNSVSCASAYISNVKNRPSVFGPLSFDNNGDVVHMFILKTVKNGKFVNL